MSRPKSATGRLEAAQAALEETTRKLAELRAKRDAALLADDDATAIALGAELDGLTQAARAYEDKARLLRDAAQREAADRRVREREGLIKRIESKLAARDQAGAELADAIKRADAAFRKLIDIGVEVTAAWSWPPSDLQACLLSHSAITHVLTHELYRVGGRPMLGGGQVEKPHAGIHFPGAKCPRHELVHLQEKIAPLTTVLQEATAHASNILRGKRPSTPVDVAVTAPIPTTNGQGERPPRTAAEQERDLTLQELIRLGQDTSLQGELRYKANLEKLRQLEDEVAAEQRVGAQHHA
jgi:hypothetical protein